MKKFLMCRNSWPKYASHEEDCTLRKEKWDLKHENKRVVMWDNTEYPFTYQPSTALNQRTTHSTCHSENCAKGGIFLQLFGWFSVAHL